MYQLLDPQAEEAKRFMSLARVGDRQRSAWQWLSDTDRLIVELASQGNTHRLIGRAVGITPGTVSRRLTAIQQRLSDPLTKALLDPATPLEDDSRTIALWCEVGHYSVQQIARRIGGTVTYVREQLRYARGIAKSRYFKPAPARSAHSRQSLSPASF